MNSHVYWYYVELVWVARDFGYPKDVIDVLIGQAALEFVLGQEYMSEAA